MFARFHHDRFSLLDEEEESRKKFIARESRSRVEFEARVRALLQEEEEEESERRREKEKGKKRKTLSKRSFLVNLKFRS